MSEVVDWSVAAPHKRWHIIPGRWARSMKRPLAKRCVWPQDEELVCFSREYLGTWYWNRDIVIQSRIDYVCLCSITSMIVQRRLATTARTATRQWWVQATGTWQCFLDRSGALTLIRRQQWPAVHGYWPQKLDDASTSPGDWRRRHHLVHPVRSTTVDLRALLFT